MKVQSSNYMYYVVYQTTNLVNGKKYIGAHSTNKLNDNYFGSGVLLKKAISKYGAHNFKKDILFVFYTFEEMMAKEKELVHKGIIESDQYYNIKEGGIGGQLTQETIARIASKNRGRQRTPEQILHSKNSRLAKSGFTAGHLNPAYNRVWLSLDGDYKYPVLDSEEYCYLIEQGYIKDTSRCSTNKGKVWLVNHSTKQIKLSIPNTEEYNSLMSKGFQRGFNKNYEAYKEDF